MGATGKRRGWPGSPAGASHPQEAGRSRSEVPLSPGPLVPPSGVEAGPVAHHTPRERAGQGHEAWPDMQADTGVGFRGAAVGQPSSTPLRDKQPTQVRAGHHSNGSISKV